jgi:predicted lipid-binding transport protein (Tim44 family)
LEKVVMNILRVISVGLIAGSLVLSTADVDAKRMGGGKSSGAKREAATQRQAAQPAATPATPAQGAAPTAAAAAPAAAKAPAAAAAPAKSGLSKWMPMLGGLAIGAALASMFGGGALGEFFANALMILAVVMIGLFIWRMIAARRAGANGGSMTPALAGAGAGAAGTQRTSYDSNNGNNAFGGNPSARAPEIAPQAAQPVAETGEWQAKVPAGFDVAGFEKGAKSQFIRLQGAFDKGEAATLKDMLTDEMYAEVDRELKSRGATAQPTEIVTLNAETIEVTTEADGHWASVRFHGLLREDGNPNAENFDEVWNLFKPLDNSAGWMLAGIQQL